MLNKPTVAELMAQGNNRYTLVIATAKRARQIAKDREDKIKKQEPLPELNDDNISPITAAANEIYNNEIKIYNEEQWNKIVEEKEEAQRIEDAKARHLEEIKMQSLASTV
jgi:DNA-directed RNA polymerase omega subunit